MKTLGPPPAGENAWSVVTLADRLHVPAPRVYLAVTDVIRAAHRDDDLRAVFRADLDQPDRAFPWDAGDPVPRPVAHQPVRATRPVRVPRRRPHPMNGRSRAGSNPTRPCEHHPIRPWKDDK